MKSIGIMTDSHSGISQKEAERLGIRVLPMPFYIGEKCCYEGELTRQEFFELLRTGDRVTTSQPSPESLMRAWRKMLNQYDELVYIPISSGLSGSCMSAQALSREEFFEKRVHVVDNGRVATPQYCTVLDALKLKELGLGAKEIKKQLEEARDLMNIFIGVDTLEYLKRGGRISAATAAVGGMLNIKPVLQLSVGKLGMVQKCRGNVKMRRAVIEALKKDIEARFQQYYEQGQMHLMAAYSGDEETNAGWVKEIKEAFPGTEILEAALPLAVCCHVGPGGLGIGCSVYPEALRRSH